MKFGIFASLAFVASITAAAAAEDVRSYHVNGTNPNGSTYAGTAVISRTNSNTCDISWQTGSTESEGFCMWSGDVVAAAYRLGDVVGLVIYDIRGDGTLDGVWTVAGKPGTGTEILTPAQ